MIIERTFEVVVVVTPKGQHGQINHQYGQSLPATLRDGSTRSGIIFQKDVIELHTETRMFHIEAKDHDQAFERGKKYGRPISARKFQRERVEGADYYEHKLLPKLAQKPYGTDNVFQNAIAMDEMIWIKKVKRADRIEINSKKDKAGT